MNKIYLITYLIAFILAVFLIPQVKRWCVLNNLYDEPNNRKVHIEKTPRLGGVAIWTSFIVTLMAVFFKNSYPFGNGLSSVLLPASLIFSMGIVDDIYDLKPKFKLIIQIACACIAFLLGAHIEFIDLPFAGHFQLGLFALPFTIVWIVGIANAVNFIDGVDGLAGTILCIISIILGVVSVALYPSSYVVPLIAFTLAGSLLGFLVFNFHPAKIFMGDSGALFCGYVLSILTVVGLMKKLALLLLIPILIFSIPILDMTFSVIRRVIKRKHILKADDGHIHHQLISAGFSHNKIVLILAFMAIVFGLIVSYWLNSSMLYLVLISFFMVVSVSIMICNKIFKR